MMVMAHQQYWSSSHNDAAADAILRAYISSSDSASPFTPHHPPHQQMGCNASVRAAHEKSRNERARWMDE